MSESANLPVNFGGIAEEEFSGFEAARILVLPVAYEGTVSYGTGTEAGAMAIVEASRNMELYDEETDAEVYKLGIHTLEEFAPRETPEAMMNALYERTKELLKADKFLCMLGGEHSVSAPVIRAHAEKFHNASIMARVVKDLRIPSVQVGIRSISADEARSLDSGLPTKIFWAKDIAGRIDWIDDAVNSLTENVYLTIDIDGLDPSLVPTTGTPEPGGLGWYETLTLIRRIAAKKRIIGMDLVEFSKTDNSDAPAFLCAKLVYKSLAYIFKNETPKVRGKSA